MSEQPSKVELPWAKSGEDEITTNFAIGSLRESLLKWLKDSRGIHAETLMVVIGALAGLRLKMRRGHESADAIFRYWTRGQHRLLAVLKHPSTI